MAAELAFWLALASVLYAYAGYPLALWAGARIFGRPVRKASIEPPVSLLIPAFNEERVIGAKIRNSLSLDYPVDKLEIVVASDGSTDGTIASIQDYTADRRVLVLAYPVNRGKLATLNETIPRLRGEIVVFSDAASMLAPDALRYLVSNFADPEVGAVSGVYRIRKASEAELGEQEDFYWKYETFLKTREAMLASTIGAHGALYAIRKKLYPFPAPGTINDDYVIPVRIVHQGYRVVYETGAVADEEAHEMGGFSRRVRIMTGNYLQLRELGAMLWPPRWLPLFFFLSHKAARLLVPVAMVVAAVANALLLDRPFYAWLFAAQMLLYVWVVAGAIWPGNAKLLKLPYYFCMINAAAFLGMYYAVAGQRKMIWRKK